MKTLPAFPRDRDLLARVLTEARKQNPKVDGLIRVSATHAVCQETGNPFPTLVPVTPAEAAALGWVKL